MRHQIRTLALVAAVALGCDSPTEKAARLAAERAAQADMERAEEQARVEKEARAKAEKDAAELKAAEEVRSALAALGKNPPADAVIEACRPGISANALKRLQDVADACASGYLTLARKALRSGELATARMHLGNLNTLTGVRTEEIAKASAQLDKLTTEEKERAEKRRERERAAQAAVERKQYAAELRDHFLDQGMDIKVSVSGSNNDRLKLQFVLFNDVWLHRFQKGSLIGEIRSKGFKRIDMSDGYNWGYYFTMN